MVTASLADRERRSPDAENDHRAAARRPGPRLGTLATVDHWATKMLAGFVIDLAFIGANGISREYGLTTPDPAVSEVKAQAMRGCPAPGLRRGPHQVRRGELLPVRRRSATSRRSSPTPGSPSAEAHRYSLLGPQVIRV